jgi:hypothetical protein
MKAKTIKMPINEVIFLYSRYLASRKKKSGISHIDWVYSPKDGEVEFTLIPK